MDIFRIRRDTLTQLGNKIRALTGVTGALSPFGMIGAIDGYISQSGSIGGGSSIDGLHDEITFYQNENADSGLVVCKPPVIEDIRVVYNESNDKLFSVDPKLIEKLVLPACESIETASDSLFQNSTHLSEVTLPALQIVPYSAFYGCNNLQIVNVPACATVEDNAFENCGSLENCDFRYCTDIGLTAFSGCSSLESINVGNCENLGENAFYGCSSLVSLDLHSVKYARDYSFADCTALSSLNLSSCSRLGDYVFQNCSSLSALSLPAFTTIYDAENNIYNIHPNTFLDCYISTLNVPNMLAIDWQYFGECPLATLNADNCTDISGFSNGTVYLETLYAPHCASLGGNYLANDSALKSLTLPVECEIGSGVLYGTLDPDNKTLEIHFVVNDPDNIVVGTTDTSPLFMNHEVIDGGSSDYGGGCEASESSDYDFPDAPIPGLEIYVPQSILDRFKTEFCSGRYANNIYAEPESASGDD